MLTSTFLVLLAAAGGHASACSGEAAGVNVIVDDSLVAHYVDSTTLPELPADTRQTTFGAAAELSQFAEHEILIGGPSSLGPSDRFHLYSTDQLRALQLAARNSELAARNSSSELAAESLP